MRSSFEICFLDAWSRRQVLLATNFLCVVAPELHFGELELLCFRFAFALLSRCSFLFAQAGTDTRLEADCEDSGLRLVQVLTAFCFSILSCWSPLQRGGASGIPKRCGAGIANVHQVASQVFFLS